MVAQGVLWILLGLLLRLEPGTATLPLLMDSVIQALAELEQKVPATKASHVASAWLLLVQDSGPRDLLHHFLLERQNLKATNLDPHQVSPELRALTKDMAQHGIRDRQEYGVVLAPDGSTVAVEPLLAGLEAGLQGRRVVNLPLDTTDLDVKPTSTGIRPGSPDVPVTSPDVHTSLPGAKARSPTTVDSLLVVTLARDLGLSFLQGPQTWSHAGLGTEGCWDQLSAPRTFTLLHSGTSPVTMAFLNGALDGVLLGDYLSRTPEPRPPLSHLLSEYYGAGVAGDPGFRSNFRRQNTAALTSTPTLTQQFRDRLRRLRVRGPRLALGGRAHARPQLSRLRRGLRGQLHCGAAYRGCASHRAGRAPWLRSARWLPAARLHAAWPPPARAGEYETPHYLSLWPVPPHKLGAQL
uniref:Peptidoglycan recognition protein 2 n=1 Tax=Canis lupus dingo TaxID=286419 RepID=A0A8C0K6Q7_CANLU